jgi:hypothetical protein
MGVVNAPLCNQNALQKLLNDMDTWGHAIPGPRRHQQHEAQAKKPGMMLALAPFLRHTILGAAFVGVAAIAKEIQDAVGMHCCKLFEGLTIPLWEWRIFLSRVLIAP